MVGSSSPSTTTPPIISSSALASSESSSSSASASTNNNNQKDSSTAAAATAAARPVFIPPRKRQTNKKSNNGIAGGGGGGGGGNNPQNYVDHIVTIQGRNKLSPITSPTNIENKIIKTSVNLLYNNGNDGDDGHGDNGIIIGVDCSNGVVVTPIEHQSPLPQQQQQHDDCFPSKNLPLQNLIINLNKFNDNDSSSATATTTTTNNHIIMNGNNSHHQSLNVTPTQSYSDNLIILKSSLLLLNTNNNNNNNNNSKSIDCLTTTTTTTTTTTDATPDDELEIINDGINNRFTSSSTYIEKINNSLSTTSLSVPVAKKRVNICTDIIFDKDNHNHPAAATATASVQYKKKSIHYYKDIESGGGGVGGVGGVGGDRTNCLSKKMIYNDHDEAEDNGQKINKKIDPSTTIIINNNYKSIIAAANTVGCTKSLNYHHHNHDHDHNDDVVDIDHDHDHDDDDDDDDNDGGNSETVKLEPPTRSETYLTMTGTIKRGRKKGQSVDLQLNISREELEKINAAALNAVDTRYTTNHKHKRNLCFYCTPTTGMHIFLLSLLCLPFVIIATGIYSFYIGTITWYNMFNYFNEEKTYLHKLIMSPLLILTYPIVIVLCTIGLGLYAGFIQISIQLQSWLNEIADVEKGFYGWLCSFLHLSDCSPYEVVILTDLTATVPAGNYTNTNQQHQQQPGNSSTEELSL